jgi:hypothetical protein
MVALLVSVGAATHALAGGPRPADVTVTILPSSPDVYVVRRIIYTVLVSDVGGLDASGVTLNATVGGNANAEAFEVTQEQGTCSIPTTGSLSCALGTVAHGSTVKIRLRVRPFLAGTIQVSAKTSAATNADKTNDTTSVSTPARPGNPGSPQLKNEDGPNAAIVIPVTTPPVVTPPVVTPPVAIPPVVTPPAPVGTPAIVSGRIGVSEAATLDVQVVNKTTGATIPLLQGSVVDSPPLTVPVIPGAPALEADKKTVLPATAPVLTAPVGDTKTPETAHPVYTLQLPAAAVNTNDTYAVVVKAKDLEGQAANVQLTFKLKKK